MAINLLKSVHTYTKAPFFLMICSPMHFRVDFWLAFTPFSPPFSYHLCVLGFVNISPLNLSVSFDRGLFYLSWFLKGGKCKALHPLLNNMTTWEASERHLHFVASVLPFGKQSNPTVEDAEGSNWQVLVVCIGMQNVAFSITSLQNKMGKFWFLTGLLEPPPKPCLGLHVIYTRGSGRSWKMLFDANSILHSFCYSGRTLEASPQFILYRCLFLHPMAPSASSLW